jgi:hypothetical protein
MALVFGNDLDQLVFNKTTVQAIYNANYNFSAPPRTPHLTAVPGDKQVFLYWDDISESSYDRFLRRKSFEGYTIYRSQEAEFNDVHTIVDSKGNPKYWKPVAQFDLIDSISGPDPVGINGAHFWRGDNTGLQHSYIDKNVKNGTKYYYAVCAYNTGDPNYGIRRTGLQPTETTKIISEDPNGVLKFVDINCAVVVPNAPAAGYIPPQIVGNLNHVSQGIGTGSISIDILNPNAVGEGTAYHVFFSATGNIPLYTTNKVTLTRTSLTSTDTLFSALDIADVSNGKSSPVFDGLMLTVHNNADIVVDTSGWLTGNSNLMMVVSPDNSASALNVKWPGDYEIRFYNTPVDTSLENPDDPLSYPAIPVNFTITNTTFNYRVKFFINDLDFSKTLNPGDMIRIIEAYKSLADFKLPWQVTYFPPRRDAPVMPVNGDRFIIRTKKPFYGNDAFTFSTKKTRLDPNLATSQLRLISVVPNPYVSTAKWEPKSIYGTGRGDRKIDFINLPNHCTVRIYSVAGGLVKTLYKDNGLSNGALSWNLVSDDGTDVAFGLYIYHVDAGDMGKYIGKFALIK